MHYEVRSIGYHLLERQLVKRLLKVYNLSSKNMCEKLVGWKSLLKVSHSPITNYDTLQRNPLHRYDIFASTYNQVACGLVRLGMDSGVFQTTSRYLSCFTIFA